MGKTGFNIVVIMVIATVAVGIAFAVALLTTTVELPSEGTTASAELTIYELDGTTLQTKLDWGVKSNGTHTQRSILKSTSNIPLKLSMTTDEAYGWLTLTWNATNHVLQPNEQTIVEWTLTLTNAPVDTLFSFNITITGEET